MNSTKISLQAMISAGKQKVWDVYTQPADITKWNFATDEWHCPAAVNYLRAGGKYVA